MLHLELCHCYYVYPSWALLRYTWNELGKHLADPLNSPTILNDPNCRHTNWRELGYLLPAQSFDLIPGPFGGGIIRAHIRRREKWLPNMILADGAHLASPPGMSLLYDFDPQVYYIEPSNEPGSEFGLGKKPTLYLCGVSTEHAAASEDNVYWVLWQQSDRTSLKGLDDVPTLGKYFGFDVTPLAEIHQSLRTEAAPWFVEAGHKCTWFRVQKGGNGLGLHYAVLVYIAFHLRKKAGKRMKAMHLVADIEGKPNARLTWYRR